MGAMGRLVLMTALALASTPTFGSSVVTSTPTTTACDAGTCLNGAICNDKYPNYGDVCLCEPGFSGPRCGESATGTPPTSSSSCTLDCSNGGVCRLGARPETELADVYRFWDDAEGNNDDPTAAMYCQCNDNWDGPTCKVSRVTCGEHHCFHGAQCLSRSEGGKTVHRCDCGQANDEDNSLYAGQFCQYPASEQCQAADEFMATGDIFCVNEGTCRSNVYEGCDCPEGFTGFACEFRLASSTNVQVVPGTGTGSHSHTTNSTSGMQDIEESHDFDSPEAAACALDCLNGGTCRHGQKPPDEAWMTATNHTTHLEYTTSIDETFAHCVCPPDFGGALCDHPVDTCGADKGKFLCLHGSKCVNVGSEQLCDCDQADSSLATFFAGNHCQHPVNEICTTEGGGTSGTVSNHVSTSSSVTVGSFVPGTLLAFCVNGGTCRKTVSRTEPHPGCNCEDGFLGPHCELRESPELPSLQNNDPYANEMNAIDDEFREEGRTGFYAIAFWVMFASVVAGLVCMLAQRYKRRRQKQRDAAITSSLKWSPAYKDRASNEINIAPGTSYSDIYEEATMEAFSRSSRDPMVTAVGASTSVSALQLERTEPSSGSSNNSDLDDFPDDLRSEPKIDIGPPIDEDGHELHNVEIV